MDLHWLHYFGIFIAVGVALIFGMMVVCLYACMFGCNNEMETRTVEEHYEMAELGGQLIGKDVDVSHESNNISSVDSGYHYYI